MKTTRVFIALFLVLAVAHLFLSEWLISGYAAIALMFSILFLLEGKKNANLKEFNDEAVEYSQKLSAIHELDRMKIEKHKEFAAGQRVKQFELLTKISELETALEESKAKEYLVVERKRTLDKYNRLYKGKKRVKKTV